MMQRSPARPFVTPRQLRRGRPANARLRGPSLACATALIVACVAENIDDYELPDSDDGSVDMVDRLYHGLEEAVHP